jgi:hypothetical protein
MTLIEKVQTVWTGDRSPQLGKTIWSTVDDSVPVISIACMVASESQTDRTPVGILVLIATRCVAFDNAASEQILNLFQFLKRSYEIVIKPHVWEL